MQTENSPSSRVMHHCGVVPVFVALAVISHSRDNTTLIEETSQQ